MKIPKFHEIPYNARRTPEQRWNFLADILNGDIEKIEDVEKSALRSISINVNDGTDNIQGASVVIGDMTKTTGRAGGCSFNGVADGHYTLEVTHEGFEKYLADITISQDAKFVVSLTPEDPVVEQD